ncbi:methyl-accepting chemotaxis protein [Cohnella faecalis]|uniref:Methyl-accepting transducer domain-containing protein n=1 Tax=Cohnella faecalis TaxID=2315694 RepID=A0A398CL09_9BACL|nr:hypothetical protein [Cohnella faecalis]RIE03085.1 hypothetical protein D3H35_21115 [Cohnella faecalis]
MVRQTNSSAKEVLDTATSLTDASRKTPKRLRNRHRYEEIANGATNLAFESEKGTDMTSEIGTQVQTVIASNVEMGNSANEVEEASRRGSDYMDTLINKTGQTEEMTRSMVEKVDKLKDSTRSIRKNSRCARQYDEADEHLVVERHNRAGPRGYAGKGFMVVADEIRKLADQSRQSIGVVAKSSKRFSAKSTRR